MIRNKVLLFIFLCLYLIVWASGRALGPDGEKQDTDQKRWRTGFVVTARGDTVRGMIKVPHFLDVNYDYQRSLTFRDRRGAFSQYGPYDLASFSYHDDRDTGRPLVTMQSVSSPQGDGLVFMRLYLSGVCRVYGYTETEQKGGSFGPGTDLTRSSLLPSEKKYIQIRGSQFYHLRGVGFKKNMKEFFSECPLIQQRLDDKTYTYDNWQTMVKDYNSGICK